MKDDSNVVNIKPQPIPEPILKKTYKICQRCDGAGVYNLPLGLVTCDLCLGTCMIHAGWVES